MISRRDLLATSGCGWMTSSLSPLRAAQAPSFRSSVNLVLLDVLVTDESGTPVPGLLQENFRIKERNKFVALDRLTTGVTNLSLAVVLDYSRSMIHAQARVVQAVEQFRRRLAPEDEAFVLAFNEKVRRVIEPAKMGVVNTAWAPLLYREKPDGQTALFDAVVQGADGLKSSVHARRAMVVLSDGKDTASQVKREAAARGLMEANVLFYAVGLFKPGEPDTDSGTLSGFAELTGGRAIFEPRLEKLGGEFDRILTELRARYVLGFLTSEPDGDNGETRRVRVFATGPNGRHLRVRTRESFYIAATGK